MELPPIGRRSSKHTRASADGGVMESPRTTHTTISRRDAAFASSLCEQCSSKDSGGGQHGGNISGGDGRWSSNGGNIRDGSSCSNSEGDG